MSTTKLYNFIRRLLPTFIAIIALTYLVYLFKNKAITISSSDVYLAGKSNLHILVSVLFLMIINWGLEVYKWKYFTLKIQKLTLIESIKSVLMGIVAGIFTPNRIGELGGRLLYIRKELRGSSIYINSLCAISQLITTIIFGLLFFTIVSDQLEYIHRSSLLVRLLSWISMIILLFIFFKGNVLRRIILKINTNLKIQDKLNLPQFTFSDRSRLLGISVIRYFVFCIQFIFILFIFIPDLNFLDGLISAGLVFLLTTIIPSGWISDLPVRTSFAFIVLEFLGYNGAYGSIASILLWIINLFIPAILGLLVIKDVKWGRIYGS